MKTKKRQRAEDSTTVTVSMKLELRNRIDAAAAAEQRSRSNYIVKVLTDAVAAYDGTSGPPCAASGCGIENVKTA